MEARAVPRGNGINRDDGCLETPAWDNGWITPSPLLNGMPPGGMEEP